MRPMRRAAPELAPLAADLRARLRDLEDEYRRAHGPRGRLDPGAAARAAAHAAARRRGDRRLQPRALHPRARRTASIVVQRPASGLVTAVEPVMRACSGTWIAHGSGTADREAVDAHDRVARAAGRADVQLRRIWLTQEEEQGYYYGFANEGLWPLCHVAHVRPVFRESDWEHYREVNQRFADAVVAEARSDDPVVLVQDYHFALLPAMIREQLPRATILTFWHIPWPNPESFGICPWRERDARRPARQHHPRLPHPLPLQELPRDGRPLPRGAHRARALDDHLPAATQTLVESYPISIEWPSPEAERAAGRGRASAAPTCSSAWASRTDHRLGVGVDRFDYTKGILERLHAVERHAREASRSGSAASPSCRSPRPRAARSRSTAASRSASRALAERINARFGRRRRGR